MQRKTTGIADDSLSRQGKDSDTWQKVKEPSKRRKQTPERSRKVKQGNAKRKDRKITTNIDISCVTFVIYVFYHMRCLARFGTICTILKS